MLEGAPPNGQKDTINFLLGSLAQVDSGKLSASGFGGKKNPRVRGPQFFSITRVIASVGRLETIGGWSVH